MERFIADDLAARNVSFKIIYLWHIFGSFSSFLWKFIVRTTTTNTCMPAVGQVHLPDGCKLHVLKPGLNLKSVSKVTDAFCRPICVTLKTKFWSHVLMACHVAYAGLVF